MEETSRADLGHSKEKPPELWRNYKGKPADSKTSLQTVKRYSDAFKPVCLYISVTTIKKSSLGYCLGVSAQKRELKKL